MAVPVDPSGSGGSSLTFPKNLVSEVVSRTSAVESAAQRFMKKGTNKCSRGSKRKKTRPGIFGVFLPSVNVWSFISFAR